MPADRKRRVREHMQRLHEEKNELLVADWDPHSNPGYVSIIYFTFMF
jgi:hypothetical protein